MAYMRVLAVVVAVTSLPRLASGAALPLTTGRPAVVRVSIAEWPSAPSSRRQLLQMMQEAEAIWQPYGVTLIWAAPWTTGPLSRADVTLHAEFVTYARLTADAARNPPRASALGAVRFFDADTPEDILMLSASEVEAVVATTRWSGSHLDALPPVVLEEMTGRALGRVLAHELGHYLLGLRTHTATGLMRPLYPGPELAGWDRQGFRLDACALERLHARMGELTATPTSTPVNVELPHPCH